MQFGSFPIELNQWNGRWVPFCSSDQTALKAKKKKAMSETPAKDEVRDAVDGVVGMALPQDALSIVAVRQNVLFPGMMLPMATGRPRSIAAVQYAARNQRPLGVLLQKDPTVDDPGPQQLFEVGTSAELLRYVAAQDGTHHAICRGVRRFRIIEFLSGYPFLAARYQEISI
jgi:ATP-dependent Lon protease